MRWNEAERILCVRLDAMGDVLMTTPALRAVKGGRERHVTLLTGGAGAAVAKHVPEVDDVITYQCPWMKSSPIRASSAIDMEMIRRLARGSYDAAVIFTVFSQNPLPPALLCFLADIPLRLAYCRENPYQLLTDWVRESEPEQGVRHEVIRQLQLLEHVGWRTSDTKLSFTVPAEARETIGALLESEGLTTGEWVAVHPGASAPSRRYPAHLFADVASRIVAEGYRLVFTGDVSELGLVEQVRRPVQTRSISVAGRLSLSETAALYSAAPVVVTNNTGPAHLAAAVGTPVVDIYALTNPQHTPWGVPSTVLSHDVPCRNCFKSVCPEGHHACLALIPPEDVARACLGLIQLGTTYDHSRHQCSIP